MQNPRYSRTFYYDLRNRLRDLITIHGNNTKAQNGKFVLAQRDSKSIPTGWNILGRGNTYEFGKSFSNLVAGLFTRLYGSKVTAD